ncbi:MAG TPA: hypothetical protein ENI33_06020 [Thermoplasmatales archaeon]|nr:hypothetical protein [Thermoplasmatales archaeon]
MIKLNSVGIKNISFYHYSLFLNHLTDNAEIFNDSIKEIIIAGNAPNGIFYGVQTLIQLLNNNSVRGVFILDYPDNKMRGVYEGYKIRFEWNGSAYEFTQEQKDYIDWLASLKFNTVFTVENGIFFKNESQWRDAYEEFFEYSRERFIEPVPRLCSISSVAPFSFEFYEGWFVENESFIFNESFALPEKPFINLLPNGDFEIDSDEDGIPDNWTVTSKPGAIWKIDNDSYSGNHSMKLEVPEPTQNSTSSYLRIEIDGIEPDSYYCLLSKAKAKNITNVRPQLTIYTKNTSGEVGVVQSDITWSTNGWIDFGCCIKTPSDTEKIVIYSRIQFPGKGEFWVDNVRLYRVNGALMNVIRASDTDIKVIDAVNKKIYVEGIDYEILNGTTSIKFSDSLTPFRIRRLPLGNISPGEEVMVSYDTYLFYRATSYWSSAPCVAREEFYTEYIYPAIDKIVYYLHPKIINADADEIRGFYRDSRMMRKFNSNAEAIAYWANRTNNYLTSKDPQCRLWIWDDMVSPYHNGGVEDYQVRYGGLPGRMAEATENEWIDKSIIMDIWWYSDIWLSQMYASSKFFREKGYDIAGSPWYEIENIESWSEILSAFQNSLGGVVTNWGDIPYEEHFSKFVDDFWNVKNNLVYFDSFEEDENNDEIPDNWFKYGNPEYSTDDSEFYGKRYADYPNCAVRVDGSNIFYSNYIPVEECKNYTISAFIRRNDSSSEKPSFKICWYDAYKNYLCEEEEAIENVSNEYGNYEVYISSPRNANYLRIYLKGEENGTESFWFDVIRLKMKKEVFSHEYSLQKGWNLITLPIKTGYNASLLYKDIRKCLIILKWNSSKQNFELYVPSSPYDFEIENGHGYLIAVENNTKFTLTGISVGNVSIPLYIGWNMLGWFKENEITASSIYENITGCQIVLKWNNSKDDFDLYVPGLSDFIIKRGDGFLVAVSEESIWHGEG